MLAQTTHNTSNTCYSLHTTHDTRHMSTEQAAAWEDTDAIERLLEAEYRDEISWLAQSYPTQRDFVVNHADVLSADAEVADDLRDGDSYARELIKSALLEVAPDQAFLDGTSQVGKPIRGEQLRIRVQNATEPYSVEEASERGAELVGSVVTLRGQVAKMTPVKPRLDTAVFKCTICSTTHEIDQPLHGVRDPPPECTANCGGGLKPSTEQSTTLQHQLVRLKHPPGQSDHDMHIDVHLTGSQAGTVTSGDNVDITGVFHDDFGDFETPVPDFWMDGHHVRKHQSDYEETDIKQHRDRLKALANGDEGDPYQLLVDSIAPGIHGKERMDRIKLALGLQLFGGWRVEKADGTAFRGDIHNWIVGAPGTGKSDLLSAIESISPRVSSAEGKNVSKKGLTAAAVKDDFGDEQWAIEAGAFVAADGGVCIIDELDKVDPDAVDSLHGALEKQRVHVSAAGKNTTLSCETALLAGGNPEHEHFVEEQTVVSQLPVGHAMRQRFDGIWVLRSQPDESHDKAVVESMLHSIASGTNVEVTEASALEDKSPAVSNEVLRAWVAHAREHCRPAFDLGTLMDRLKEHYWELRDSKAPEAAPVSARVVGSMLRYAMASARVRLGDRITEADINRAKRLVMASKSQIDLVQIDGGEVAVKADDGGSYAEGKTQKTRKEEILATIKDEQLTPAEIAEKTDYNERTVERELESMKETGDAYEPRTGVYRGVN